MLTLFYYTKPKLISESPHSPLFNSEDSNLDVLFNSRRYNWDLSKTVKFTPYYDLNIYSENYSQQQAVVSQISFKNNLRYHSYAMYNDSFLSYYCGRELLLLKEKRGSLLKKKLLPIGEVILKSVYTGLNSYSDITANQTLHFLKFSPLNIKYNKEVFFYFNWFLKLDELSLKFVLIELCPNYLHLKKMSSVKKNRRKQALNKSKKNPYNLIFV